MLRDHATKTRTAARPVLAHERAAQYSSRCVKAFDCACLGLALFGAVSTVAAWQAPPPRVATSTGGHVSDRGEVVQPAHEDLDLGAFVRIAGR